MNMLKSFFIRLTAYFLLFFSGSLCQPLSATIINVGPPPASIQTAINSAINGDTIQLSAGTYIQEVQVISKSIDIIGAGRDVTVIQSPDALTRLTQNFVFGGINFWCIVMVDNQASPTPQTVNIRNLTVNGSDQQDTTIPPIYGNSDRFFGIGYHNANGTVSNVHTASTRQYVNFNELAGGGIINASDTATALFNVNNCFVDTYQRLGIDCRGATLTAHISNTSVDRGYVLPLNTITATPNGIQFSSSALGSIMNCSVQSNISTVAGASASGILVFGGGSNITVSGNTVSNNDLGIASINTNTNLNLDSNTFNYTTTPGVNTIEGLRVQDTAGTSIISNNIFNNIPNINMDLASSTNQIFQLSNNQFLGSQVGLLITGSGALGPVVSMDHDSFTGTSGYYIQEIAAPNDVWPTTATVSFDGLVSGSMTFAQFNQVLTKIFDKHNDPALGLVLDFIPPPTPLPPSDAIGVVCKNNFAMQSVKMVVITWDASASADVDFYRVYHNGILIGEVPADGPLVFSTRFTSGSYQVTAVNTFGNESGAVTVQIVKH